MNRKDIEAEFARRLKSEISPSAFRMAVEMLRAVFDDYDRMRGAQAADVEAHLAETKDRIYGIRDGE